MGSLRQRHLTRLALASMIALGVRLAMIAWTPEPEGDAYGHFMIAAAFLRDPGNLAVHWVWLPGWHVIVAAARAVGISHDGVRVGCALLQAVAPFILYDLVGRAGAGKEALEVAFLSALAWTVAPLSTLLGASAQPETLFTALLVGTVAALERRRGLVAGALLSMACLLRYEAWGSTGALALLLLVRRKKGPPLASVLVPLGVIGGYITLRRFTDGEWLAFVRWTRSFVIMQREVLGISRAAAALLFTVVAPFASFGPAFLLAPLGLRRFLRESWIVPGGVLAFFLMSYAGGGSLPLFRYWTSLVPFTCAAMAAGAFGVARWFPRWSRGTIAKALLVSLALVTAVWLGREVWRVVQGAELAIQRQVNQDFASGV